jgi:hypothetical protein
MQDLWNTIKRQNLRTMGIEGKEVKTKNMQNIFNKIIAENFPNTEKKSSHADAEDFWTLNRQDQK